MKLAAYAMIETHALQGRMNQRSRCKPTPSMSQLRILWVIDVSHQMLRPLGFVVLGILLFECAEGCLEMGGAWLSSVFLRGGGRSADASARSAKVENVALGCREDRDGEIGGASCCAPSGHVCGRVVTRAWLGPLCGLWADRYPLGLPRFGVHSIMRGSTSTR